MRRLQRRMEKNPDVSEQSCRGVLLFFSTSCGHTTDGTIWGASLSSVPYLKGVAVRPGGGQLDLTDEDTFSSFIKSAASWV